MQMRANCTIIFSSSSLLVFSLLEMLMVCVTDFGLSGIGVGNQGSFGFGLIVGS